MVTVSWNPATSYNLKEMEPCLYLDGRTPAAAFLSQHLDITDWEYDILFFGLLVSDCFWMVLKANVYLEVQILGWDIKRFYTTFPYRVGIWNLFFWLNANLNFVCVCLFFFPLEALPELSVVSTMVKMLCHLRFWTLD